MAIISSVEKAITAVSDALIKESRVVVTTHIKPDADGLGCLTAMHMALKKNNVDSIMYLSDEKAIAPEYTFLKGIDEIERTSLPEDTAGRTLIALDCSNAERIGDEELLKTAKRIINIDHHSDNTRFGEVNLVIGNASSTAEILYFVLQKMGIDITADIAEALYTGILVDSGRFQYSSTSATTFRVTADLINRGVDHTAIFRKIFETVPLAKARLMCRMLSGARFACNGRLAVGVLEREDFKEAGAGSELTEGLINSLREIENVGVAALIYALPPEDESPEATYRVSLRSSIEKANVQRIAKLKGGGGHPQASGFTATGEKPSQIIEFLTKQTEKALSG